MLTGKLWSRLAEHGTRRFRRPRSACGGWIGRNWPPPPKSFAPCPRQPELSRDQRTGAGARSVPCNRANLRSGRRASPRMPACSLNGGQLPKLALVERNPESRGNRRAVLQDERRWSFKSAPTTHRQVGNGQSRKVDKSGEHQAGLTGMRISRRQGVRLHLIRGGRLCKH